MESGRIGAEIAPLAAVLRADPPLCALANDGNLASIRALSAPAAAAVDAVIARIGHRGLGEAELANLTFADDPALLLKTAAEIAARLRRASSPSDVDPATGCRHAQCPGAGARHHHPIHP